MVDLHKGTHFNFFSNVKEGGFRNRKIYKGRFLLTEEMQENMKTRQQHLLIVTMAIRSSSGVFRTCLVFPEQSVLQISVKSTTFTATTQKSHTRTFCVRNTSLRP